MTRDILWWSVVTQLVLTLCTSMHSTVTNECAPNRVAAFMIVWWTMTNFLCVWFWAPWGQG